MERPRPVFKPFLIALVVAAVGFVGGQLAPKLISFSPIDNQRLDFSDLNHIYNLLKQKYDGNLTQAEALDGAREGVAASTGDPYTAYLDAEEAKQLSDQLSGTVSGIGAEVGVKNGKLTIISPVSGSPAEKAGLRAGDVVAKINDLDTTGLSIDQAVSKIRGRKGTQVTLKILRSASEPKDITITRDVINVPSVKWSMKESQIGYIQVSEFGGDTISKTQQAASELSDQGAKKIILDLRNNPGGYLESAVGVSSQFLSSGKLVVEERHDGRTRDKQTSQAGGKLVGLPTIVLINEGSASASEIVAGALHDNKAAKLIGEKSFGKGSVQEITKLSGGAQLKVTVAHWFTPGGKNIDKEGIRPDIEVKQTQADFDASRDPQLDRAIQELR